MEQSAHYMRVEPNSHFYTMLEQLITSIEFDIQWHASKEEREERIRTADYPIVDMHEPLTPEYLIIGLNNSLKNGYELKYDGRTMIKTQFYSNCVKNIISYIEETDWNLNHLLQHIQATLNNGYNLNNGIKMERTEVYKRLDTERLYQDLQWSTRRTLDGTPDEQKPPAEWINYIEYHIGKAKESVYMLNDQDALAEIRKVAALAVRCIEIHGCPERVIPEELLNGV